MSPRSTLDDTMVELARKRLHQRRVSLSVGDVCDIHQPAASHDTVVDFGIIHHVPQWQQAISEIGPRTAPWRAAAVRRSPPAASSTPGCSAHSPSIHAKTVLSRTNSPPNWPATACTAPHGSNTTSADSSSLARPERTNRLHGIEPFWRKECPAMDEHLWWCCCEDPACPPAACGYQCC